MSPGAACPFMHHRSKQRNVIAPFAREHPCVSPLKASSLGTGMRARSRATSCSSRCLCLSSHACRYLHRCFAWFPIASSYRRACTAGARSRRELFFVLSLLLARSSLLDPAVHAFLVAVIIVSVDRARPPVTGDEAHQTVPSYHVRGCERWRIWFVCISNVVHASHQQHQQKEVRTHEHRRYHHPPKIHQPGPMLFVL